MAYGNWKDYKNNPGRIMTQDFQDYDGDGIDDRKQGGKGQPSFLKNPEYYEGGGGNGSIEMGQGPSASEPQTPSNNVSDTTPDPQEFADKKVDETKTAMQGQGKFNAEDYLAANKDVNDWWNDGSQEGIFRGSGAVREKYGVDTDGWEDNWVQGMNKAYGTSHTDLGQFTRDQYAQHHYKEHGMNEGRNTSLAAQSPTQPETPAPQPTQPVQPDAPNQPTQPVETKPPTLVEHEDRFAASNAFRDQLEATKNLGQTPAPQTPQAPQTPNNNNNNVSNTSPDPQEFADQKKEEVKQTYSTSQTPENTNSQYQPFLSDTSKSLLDLSKGKIDNNQGLTTGRERVDSIVNNASQGYETQLQREADMRANSPITQDVTNRFQQFSLLNDDAQRGRGDFSSFANAAIQGGRNNRAIDQAALDMDIRRGIQNMGDKAALSNFNIFGDMGRNSRENPYSWTPSRPTPKVKTPDFQRIYRDNMDNINSI